MLKAFISLRGLQISFRDLINLIEMLKHTRTVDGFIIAVPSDMVGGMRKRFGRTVKVIAETIAIPKDESPWHKFRGFNEHFYRLQAATKTSSILAVHPRYFGLSLRTIEDALKLFRKYGGVVFALREVKDHPCQLKRCYQIISTGYAATLVQENGAGRVNSTPFPFFWASSPIHSRVGGVYERIIDDDEVGFKEFDPSVTDPAVAWRKVDDRHAALCVSKEFLHVEAGEITGIGFPDMDGRPEVVLYRRDGKHFARVEGDYPDGLMLKLTTVSGPDGIIREHVILATDSEAVALPYDPSEVEGAAYVLLKLAIDQKYNHTEDLVSSIHGVNNRNGCLVTTTGKAVNGRQGLPSVYEISEAFTIFDSEGARMLALQSMPVGCRGFPVPWNELAPAMQNVLPVIGPE